MTDKKKSIIYVVCAYGFFWVSIALIGLLVLLMGDDAATFQQTTLFRFLPALAAWTPTLALFVLFKKLYPGSSIKAFYKNAFRARLNIKLLLCVTAIQLAAFFGSVGIIAFMQDLSFRSLLDVSLPTLISGFLWTSIQGATGEQSGWRGFLQPHLEKKHSVIKASVIVGLVWGFWHAPLWFALFDFTGLALVQFIVVYMVAITMTAIVIGICYNHCKNLFVPIWIHFMFNFAMTMYTGATLPMLTWLAVLYVLVAAGYIIWHFHKTPKCLTSPAKSSTI